MLQFIVKIIVIIPFGQLIILPFLLHSNNCNFRGGLLAPEVTLSVPSNKTSLSIYLDANYSKLWVSSNSPDFSAIGNQTLVSPVVHISGNKVF